MRLCNFVLCAIALVCGGCAISQASIVAQQTRELSMPYDEVFDMVKHTMFSRGRSITFLSKEEGVISSEFTEVHHETSVGLGLALFVFPILFFERQAIEETEHISVLMTSLDANRTEIRVVIAVDGKDITSNELTDELEQALDTESAIQKAKMKELLESND